MIGEIFEKRILIFGCGNTLFGDDGFGPAVIAHIAENVTLPDDIMAEDVGTSIGDLLFDIALSPEKPEGIFIVDAVSRPGRKPGELFEIELEDMPDNKAGDFCMHQFPSVNLLRELRDAGIRVRILAVQITEIPDVVRPGLSSEVAGAVPGACEWLLREVGRDCVPAKSETESGSAGAYPRPTANGNDT